MFPIVARSASGRDARPSPKYSTNLPTTPTRRSVSVTVSTRSVAVALDLQLDVPRERGLRPEEVDLHRVVDDQLDRDQRIDLRRIAAEVGHRGAHPRQIDDGGYAGEVLQQHARRRERDLLRRLGL